MYPGVKTTLGDWTTVLDDTINAAAGILTPARTPVYNPMTLPASQYPGGVFNLSQTSPYTMPLLIGGGVLLLLALTRRRS